MQKILISEDKVQAAQEFETLKTTLLPKAKEISKIWDLFGMEPMEATDFQDIIKDTTQHIRERYAENVEAELKKMNAKIPFVKDKITEDMDEAFDTIIFSMQSASGAIRGYDCSQLVVKSGKVTVSPDAENYYTEKYRRYITTENGARLYAMHKNAVKSMNEFLEAAQKRDRLMSGLPLSLFQLITLPHTDKLSVGMAEIYNYDELATEHVHNTLAKSTSDVKEFLSELEAATE